MDPQTTCTEQTGSHDTATLRPAIATGSFRPPDAIRGAAGARTRTRSASASAAAHATPVEARRRRRRPARAAGGAPALPLDVSAPLLPAGRAAPHSSSGARTRLASGLLLALLGSLGARAEGQRGWARAWA